MRAHPLARALRVDKLTLAALEATLALYRDPAKAVREIPALAMITAHDRARARARRRRAVRASRRSASSTRWSRPTAPSAAAHSRPRDLESAAIRLAGDATRWDQRARAPRAVPVIGRIADGAMLLDVRAVRDGEEQMLADAVRAEAASDRACGAARSSAPRPAVFFDRDGTLIHDRHYLKDPNDVELLPDAANAVRLHQLCAAFRWWSSPTSRASPAAC